MKRKANTLLTLISVRERNVRESPSQDLNTPLWVMPQHCLVTPIILRVTFLAPAWAKACLEILFILIKVETLPLASSAPVEEVAHRRYLSHEAPTQLLCRLLFRPLP